MPIYEYECKNCGHVFDVLQKMSDDPLAECPECGQPDLRKLLSAPNFHLKGSGWYATDFKPDKKPSSAESPDGGSKAADGDKKSAGSDEKKGESKSKPESDGKPSGGGDKAD
jgi:putative FmdB family regulatory protein